jgi:hypothetical protein
MRISVRVKVNIAACRRTIHRQVHPKISDALFELIGIFDDQFSGVKTGPMYRRPGGGLYQASAPGEPPAIRSGDLKRSIGQPQFPAPNVGQLPIGAPYTGKLERGTVKMAARPFIHPAIKLLIERRRRRGRP